MGLVRIDWHGGVATLVLDRPARHNALTPDLLDDLLAAMKAAQPNAKAMKAAKPVAQTLQYRYVAY